MNMEEKVDPLPKEIKAVKNNLEELKKLKNTIENISNRMNSIEEEVFELHRNHEEYRYTNEGLKKKYR